MKDTLVNLARRYLPKSLRYRVQRYISLSDLKRSYFADARDHTDVTESADNDYGSPVTVGIVRNRVGLHGRYVQACLELSIPFRVLDLGAPDWLDTVHASGCGVFLGWPDSSLGPVAKMNKDRMLLIEQDLGLPLFPGSHEIWMYEDKVRMRDWLAAHNVAHPETWIFYDRGAALAFAETCELPIVFKTRFGAKAAGVHILRDRAAVRNAAKTAFGRGHFLDGYDRRDREWGSALFQRFLPEAQEWRLVRIGNAYFGHPKGKLGDFHSGSGLVEWTVPEARHLDLLHRITEEGRFRSMCADVFETPDGRLLVNELQTVFGASTSVDQLRVNGVAGRMNRGLDGGWRFEPGDWARNACANARVIWAVEHAGDLYPDLVTA